VSTPIRSRAIHCINLVPVQRACGTLL